MVYKGMITPFPLTSFEEMKKKEIDQYFNWFIETKDERIRHLQEYVNHDTTEVILDKTPESLINLWRWFESKIEMEPKSESEIEEELKMRPEWMKVHVLEHPKKFTMLTLTIAYDVSVYFGEVLIKKNPKLYWGYLSKPKKLDGVNRPRIMGLEYDMSFFPFNRILVCMRKSIRTHDEYLLYNAYEISKRSI